MLLPILISALVGGIIGYSTNWLAIKMLFRPLREKYIGPWRVPFTPGLIPKKRADLARSLGKTVTEYLVTTETLVTALQHPQFTQHLENLLRRLGQKLVTEERTVEELLQTAGLADQISDLPEHLAEKILLLVAESSLPELLADGSQELPLAELSPTLNSFLRALFSSQPMREKLLAELEALRGQLQADETKLVGDVLPLALQELVHNSLLADGPLLLDWLHQQLQKPAQRRLIESFIQRFLAGNTMLRLLSAFADTGKLADTLIQSLTKEEVRAQIISFLLVRWQQLLEQPLAPLVAKVKLPELKQLDELLSSDQWGPWVDQLASIVQASACAIGDDPQLVVALNKLVTEAISLFIGAPSTKTAVASLLRRWLQVTPAQLFSQVELPSPAALAPRLQAILCQGAVTYGAELLSVLRLTEIVEGQVNDLDILQVEEILLQIIRDQLAAITNLGFLLGALIGTLTPFINKLLGL
ncbi:MAG: DUF445 family protein [Firmicutes bacterium]|nr:DUF445 family protein [Bacillota bacterium]